MTISAKAWSTSSTGKPPDLQLPLRMWRLPGVYRPQEDTWLLANALHHAAMPPEARVLDICTGTGALAVVAAKLGARSVAALDTSRRAVLTARINGFLRRLPMSAKLGTLAEAMDTGPFDVVLANPPYVPCEGNAPPAGSSRAWDAGHDGRAILDELCQNVPKILAKQGFMLLVQSKLSNVDKSIQQLRTGGLKASVVRRSLIPFGPVLRERTKYLEDVGLIEAGQQYEELVVIRADRTGGS